MLSSTGGSTSQDAPDDWTLFKPAAFQTTTAATVEGTKEDSMSTTRTQSNKNNSNNTRVETTSMGMKVVSVRANNGRTTGQQQQHPLVPATILHIDPCSGIVDAIVAATYLTAVRTAAGSAIAIHHYFTTQHPPTPAILPPLLPQHVVVFGAGLQAEQHIRAIACIFQYSIPRVTIINRNTERSEKLKQKCIAEQWVTSIIIESLTVENTKRIEETILLTADVIVTCTNTATPLWGKNDGTSTDTVEDTKHQTNPWIQHHLSERPCIIAGIGSYTPSMQEVPCHVVNACQQIWIDTPEAIHVGDLKHLASSSSSTPELLGTVLLSSSTTSTNKKNDTYSNGLVFYKAVGTAIQDILTADVILDKARTLGIGTNVDMS
jgi:ornithine cyclodeaminase